jgi:hypothetical protein
MQVCDIITRIHSSDFKSKVKQLMINNTQLKKYGTQKQPYYKIMAQVCIDRLNEKIEIKQPIDEVDLILEVALIIVILDGQKKFDNCYSSFLKLVNKPIKYVNLDLQSNNKLA